MLKPNQMHLNTACWTLTLPRELDTKLESGDVEDVLDVRHDEQANLKSEEETKALDAAPKNKMVQKPSTKSDRQ